MENVSKALLIAGGILIAIIIISLFLSMYNRVSSIAKTEEEKKEIEQIQEFNAGYEAFDKSIMYGVDVITLFNKIDNNNHINPRNQIILKLDGDVVNSIVVDKKNAFVNGTTIVDFDKKLFKCTGIDYDDKTGKVNQICIEQKN